MKKRFLQFSFSLILLSLITSVHANAADWQRTVVFMFGQTQSGQDMFIRGGIDHTFAQNNLGRNCTAENKLCAIPIQHLNNKNATTNPWKVGDSFLDWYGPEINQSTQSEGTPMDWTTNAWPSSWGAIKTVEVDGFGETPLNEWGHHYWMMDVMMDCSATLNGWFELKSYISNGPGWEGNVSQSGAPYSSGNHFAKCGKINKFERGSNAALIKEFVNLTPSASKFYIQVDLASDFVFLQVNGIERMRWGMTGNERNSTSNPIAARMSEKIDITHLLATGENTLKLVAVSNNEGHIGSYSVKLWADDSLILSKFDQKSIVPNFKPILLDQSLKVNLLGGAATHKLSITTSNSFDAAIYINNVYTGKKAPASFDLPAGEYRIGVGESLTTANWTTNSVNIASLFREQDIVMADQDIFLNSGSMPLLHNNNVNKVAVIPLTNVHHGLTDEQAAQGISATPDNIGTMTNDDILVAQKSLQETSDQWLRPISYGQTSWEITMLQPVTERLYLTNRLLWDEAQHGTDLSGYDIIIMVIANRVAGSNNDQRHIIGLGGAASGRVTWLPQSWLDGNGSTLTDRLANVKPSPGMLHESLHVYDFYTRSDYNGVAFLHGGEEHGYVFNDCDLPSEWVCWYQNYARSQVAEDTTTTHEITATTKPTTATTSHYVGVFNLLHSGIGARQLWSYSKPTSRIENIAHAACIDVSNGSLIDNAGVIGGTCNSDNSQRWTLKHIQNGTYQLLNENSQRCAEVVNGQLLQIKCRDNNTNTQRFVMTNGSNGEFNLKTLSGQCLTLPAFSATITAETCNSGQFNQLWKMN